MKAQSRNYILFYYLIKKAEIEIEWNVSKNFNTFFKQNCFIH